MSQRPPASRPASRSPPAGQRMSLPPVQVRDDPQIVRQLERRESDQGENRTYPPIQPSAQHGRMPLVASSGEDWRSMPSRGLGLGAMLNPTDSEGPPVSSRRISSGTTDSGVSGVGPQPYFAPSPTSGTPYAFPGHQEPSNASPPQDDSRPPPFPRGRETPPRRILTPTTRNPQNRAPSLGRPSTGTINAQRSPFLPQRGRQYTAGSGRPGSETPPVPTLPAQAQQQNYGFPTNASTPGHDRPPALSTMNAPRQGSPSQSASPSMSAASANLSSSQTSPAAFLYKGGPSPASGSYFPGQSFAPAPMQAAGGGGQQYQAPSASGTEGPYSAPPPSAPASTSGSSSRQTSDPIQVLTITTSQGIYNVPVDVHQASRLADEKRARNAGASARFRQRRKEKEKEASTTIEKMQQTTRDLERKIRDVEQERDFYREERDRFRDLIYRSPDIRHLAMQAPPSPRSLRASSFQGSMAPGGGPPPPPPPMNYQAESAPERASRRRRTDASGEFTGVVYTLPPASTLPPVQASNYPAQGQPNLPPMRMESTNASQSSTPVTTTGPPPPLEPYFRGPYDRPWPGPGGRR